METSMAKEVYVGWEEVYVCSEKGKREIHYVLKRIDGGSDLAVIAKEKSLRHMTYRFLFHFSSLVKPKSRREVLHWLNSFLPPPPPPPPSDSPTPISPQLSGGSADGSEPDELDIETMKVTQLLKLGHHTKEFLWLGSQWTCKKRRKHYQAFRRNGVKVTVNQFVHVLAEENKRLVAYLDDMYEDAKGNKMVVVRWFHKIDEVGIALPQSFNDREIFFSLCLQDLGIECIDGFAMVLSPGHYAKFACEAKHAMLQPYMCCEQYDNDDLKPLDITEVKGYWNQDVVRYITSLENMCVPNDLWKKEDISAFSGSKPRKRLRLSRECKANLQSATVGGVLNTVDVISHTEVGLAQCPDVTLFRNENTGAVAQHTAVGSTVEVLSQDSGMRGCWFTATIIKKRKDKVKLRYHDVKDAENEANCLEEWVLASRIADHDEMGLRMNGRTAIRPSITRNAKVSWVMNIGTIVDAWWHDGWWEGIVIQAESTEKLQVYFPGEKREAGFSRSDLRHSQEWVAGTWKELSERGDVAVSILSELVKQGKCRNYGRDKHMQTLVTVDIRLDCDMGKDYSCGTKDCYTNLHMDTAYKKENDSAVIDLSKDDFLSQLKWKPSCKRRRNSGFVIQKLQGRRSYGINSETTKSHENHQNLVIRSTLKVEKEGRKSAKADRDNCKCISDSLFIPSVVPPLTNLVMSR